MILNVNLPTSSYDVIVENGVLGKVSALIPTDRKVLVVTDDGVPPLYAQSVLNQFADGFLFTLPAGENSKSLLYFEKILRVMLENGFSRKDAVVAVGGGIVGDLAGFVAASYMRGVDFYNIPTTLLSQVDSSIGGKTAVNFCGIKNIVGAFYQPKGVLIDPEVLSTLPRRQIANGMAEVIKMALTFDADLFYLLERLNAENDLAEMIFRALSIKRAVVMEDEKESGVRKVLNFGHTIGHGIESLGGLHHGECVALGMIPMCDRSVRQRVCTVFEKYSLPTRARFSPPDAMKAIAHDKKGSGETVDTVFVPKIGSYEYKKLSLGEIERLIREVAE